MDFEILIEHSTKGTFTLLGNKGFAWKKLNFRDGTPEKVYQINEFGMDDATNKSQFILTIQCQKEEIILKSSEGNAWTNLAFSCIKGKSSQIIDAFGMK